MGLQDRDYMHRVRNNRPRQDHRSTFRSLLWVLCSGMVVAVVLMRTNDWWIARQQAHVPAAVQGTRAAASPVASLIHAPVKASPDALDDGTPLRFLPRPAVEAAPSHPHPQRQTQLVYKCVVNGRVTYSGPDECKGGLASQLDVVSAPDPGARQFTSSAAQAKAGQFADDPVAQRLQAPADDAAQAAATAHVRHLEASRRAECLQLDGIIGNLDSQARQPSSGQMQDWIRSQRTDARSRQFALHC